MNGTVTLMRKQMSAAFGIDLDALLPDFFLKEGNLSIDGLELNIFHTGIRPDP